MTENQKFSNTSAQDEAIDKLISSTASNFCIYGSSRSGKSVLIMKLIIIRASKCKSDHLIVRSTFSAAKASIWQKTLPDVFRMFFPDLSYKLNQTDYICTLPNGSTIRIAGLDDDKRIEKILGNEYSSLWVNESNQVPFGGVSKLRTRLAQKNQLRKMTYFDLNPTNTSSWVYQIFEQKVNPQDGEALIDPENYSSFQLNVQSNLSNIDPEYLKLLESLPEKERKRFLYGIYDKNNSGAAVYAFNRDEHVSDTAIKLQGTVFVGSDFNYKYNSDVLCSRNANNLYVWGEVQIEGDTWKKCDELKKQGGIGATVVADGTGKARRTSGVSDHQIMKEQGFNLVHQTNPLVKDKIANLNRCFSMGIIVVHPSCKKLIRDLMQTVWDKNEDLDQKSDPSLTHLVDALAYLCWKYYPLIQNAQRIYSTAR